MIVPPWLGDEEFHQSHINNLARKALSDVYQWGRTELEQNMMKMNLYPTAQNTAGAYVWPYETVH
jgi:hypothetical protein